MDNDKQYLYTIIIITVIMDAFFRSKYCYVPLFIAAIISFLSWIIFLYISAFLAEITLLSVGEDYYALKYPPFWFDAFLVPFTALLPQILFRLTWKQSKYMKELGTLMK
eukprot:c17216_g1_i3.p1 GENE.c17216_g1_i3~~c17216_g1_i3.p1  ORF type:complete len:109 (-),score=34.72 c17216_g1_i3:39-365(-)